MACVQLFYFIFLITPLEWNSEVFSAPEPKAEVHYCDHALSVVCRPSSLTFRFLLWNCWTEFNETWQEARSQRPLPGLCFSDRSEKTRWPPWLLIGWDIFDFSKTAERNSTKLDVKQDHNVLYQVCVFRTDRKKTRWPPWPLIHWDIFDFSSETVEGNSPKLERKQDFNVLYKLVFFQTDQKNKMAALASDWLRHFRLFLRNRWTEYLRNLTGSKISTFSTKFVFFGPIGKTRWPPWPICQKSGTLYSGARYVALWVPCLVVVLPFCMCVSVAKIKHFYLGHNFWTVRDRDFRFVMHTQLMKSFQMATRSLTLWSWMWPLCYKWPIWTMLSPGAFVFPKHTALLFHVLNIVLSWHI